MPSTIITKNGSGAPLAADLVAGELAVDLTNGRLYTEDSGGSVIEIGLNPSGNVDVTGTVTADGLTVDGTPVRFVSTAPMLNFMESGVTDSNHRLRQNAGNFVIQKLSDDEGTATDRLLIDGGTGDISFYEDTGTTAKLFWDASAESLGIGTTSPSSATWSNFLQVEATYPGVVYNSTAGGSNYKFSTGVDDDKWLIRDETAAATRLTVDASGNVGIGVSPAKTLDVRTSSGSDAVIRVGSSSSIGINVNVGAIEFYSADADDAGVKASIANYVTGNEGPGGAVDGNLIFSTTDSDGGGNDSPTERMRIDSSGNVGISVTPSAWAASSIALQIGAYSSLSKNDALGAGDLSCNAYLTTSATDSWSRITGNSATRIHQRDGSIQFKYAASDTAGSAITWSESMRIDSSGNVGIGTSSVTTFGGYKTLHFKNESGNAISLAESDGGVIAQTICDDAVGVTIGSRSNHILRITTNDAEAMRIDSTGRVGIGRTPSISSSKLEVGGADNVPLINVEASGVTGGMGIGSTGLQFFHGSSAKMRIDSSGNLLVGTTSAVGTVTIGGSSAPSQPALYMQTYPTGHPTAYIYRDNTDTQYCLKLRHDGPVSGSGNGYMVLFTDRNDSTVGSITVSGSTTAYNTSSDQRLKDNIVDAPSASDDIDAIQVRSFDWKADGSHQKYGMVAQELLTVAPEAVHQPEDPEEMMGVDYSKLVPMMLKEIQSLRARVAQLEGAN